MGSDCDATNLAGCYVLRHTHYKYHCISNSFLMPPLKGFKLCKHYWISLSGPNCTQRACMCKDPT